MFEKEREMKMEKARKKKSGDEGREITHERWRYIKEWNPPMIIISTFWAQPMRR